MNELINSIAKTTSYMIYDEEEKIITNFMRDVGFRPNQITQFIYDDYSITEYLVSNINNIIIYKISLYHKSLEIKHQDIEITLKVD